MGKCNFNPLQNRHPSTDHQTICHKRLCRRPLQLSIGGFWANGWNITKVIVIYTPFWELTYRSDPSTDFHAWWFKRSYGSPFRDQKPQKLFGAWIGVFKPNSRNRKTCISSKLLHRSFVHLFVFAGRGPAYGLQRCDLYVGPMRQPRERRGIGGVCGVCARCVGWRK